MSIQTVECIVCGHVGATKTKGSVAITIFLLFWGILPGVVYEIWRRSSGKVCSACGSSNVRLFIPRPIQNQQQNIEPPKISGTKLVAADAYAFNKSENGSIKFDENGIELKNCPDCKELIRIDARKCKHCASIFE
ncbi:Pmp3 family protein [Acinetobacter colistiniresistens]|uniref:Pmp3 family protein n=1 Tax=Acinetobacter colistiniresistens TaxID=280145 RepID=UPI00211D09D8|nr:Pmp3 family protein [Acinetobacter colistiniresistens]UUM26278.1 Pmp3 family protein [Acinetobacter colistiniresistens]